MLAGMGGVSYADLVVAVTEAGGFGTLGAAPMSLDRMRAEIAAIGSRTSGPFGVDLLTALPDQMEAQVEAVIAGGASVFVAGLGVPRDVVDTCHRGNVLVANMCGRVRHAVAAVEAGCDIVIAQGTEAGGHTGTVATMPLVPQIVDAVGARVPVVAAGGIFDGRGLAAALALGADGVWVGTRFIATPEAHVVSGYRDALLVGHEDDTVITRAYTGKTMRAIRNGYTTHFEEHAEEVAPFPLQIHDRSRTARCTSERAPTSEESTQAGSATRPARAWARSTRSSRPATSCVGSSRKPSDRSPAWASPRPRARAGSAWLTVRVPPTTCVDHDVGLDVRCDGQPASRPRGVVAAGLDADRRPNPTLRPRPGQRSVVRRARSLLGSSVLRV